MANRDKSKRNPIARAASALTHGLAHATDRLLHRGKRDREVPVESVPELPPRHQRPARPSQTHPRRVVSDIPFERVEHAYTPTQTSLKTGFRADGSDRQRDQELADGVADERWNNEDRFTNRSGDPRIGTHGRTYESGERRAARNDFEIE